MRYRTTEQADEEIIGIYLHSVRIFGTAQAERYQEGLFQAFALLAMHPKLA